VNLPAPSRAGLARLGQRILIVGCGGAGKSTLARGLGAATGLPVVHLDCHYWKSGWRATPREQWHADVAALIQAPAWIMDGNFGDTLRPRVEACDSILFLDLPRWVCFAGIFIRLLRYRGKTRPDLPAGCPEQIDREFLLWVWNFPERSRPRLEHAIAEYGKDKLVLRFTTRRQIERLLAECER
jgi:adenylate kinase family enzyme